MSRFKNSNHSSVQDQQSPTICQHQKSSFPLTVEAPSISNMQHVADTMWQLENQRPPILVNQLGLQPISLMKNSGQDIHTSVKKKNIIDTDYHKTKIVHILMQVVKSQLGSPVTKASLNAPSLVKHTKKKITSGHSML